LQKCGGNRAEQVWFRRGVVDWPDRFHRPNTPAGKYFRVRSVCLQHRIGDVSYGLYVYAFPIQQTIIYNLASIEPWTLFAVALPLTAFVGWISWHVIEKRALALKGKVSRRSNSKPGDARLASPLHTASI
jgi:peptidoglycan/LPS O-acetylase OafA/YrhL